MQHCILRYHYHALKTSIAEERENILKAEFGKFEAIISKVESLQNLVQRPREQVSYVDTLFDLTSTLLATLLDAHRKTRLLTNLLLYPPSLLFPCTISPG